MTTDDNIPPSPATPADASKPDWRTKEARAARRLHLVAKASVGACSERSPSVSAERAWVDPAVEAAVKAVDGAQYERDGVARKLDGGSEHATANDLARVEARLREAKLSLGDLSPKHSDGLVRAMC